MSQDWADTGCSYLSVSIIMYVKYEPLDLHTTRLICVSTVEENILRKANQKRMLGDIAIEGGAFTTDFFKQVCMSLCIRIYTHSLLILHNLCRPHCRSCLPPVKKAVSLTMLISKLMIQVIKNKTNYPRNNLKRYVRMYCWYCLV